MSNEKFTQGEWFVEEYHTMLDISVVEHGGVCTVHTDTAMREHLIDPTPEQAANAHLIASAPDMYREIESDIDTLIEFIKTLKEHSNDWLFYTSELDRKEMLLAKARGES